jgi:hypothetical protein
MFFKILAPERLKGAAGAVQGVEFCKVGIFTTQIAPFDFMGCNSRIRVTGNFHVKKVYFLLDKRNFVSVLYLGSRDPCNHQVFTAPVRRFQDRAFFG